MTTPQSIIERAIGSASADGYVDVIELANSYEIDVYSDELGDERNAFIRYEGDGKFSITTNENQSRQRQRFSIAHELAHFALHRDAIIEKEVVDRDSKASLSPEEESAADDLAAQILMPEELVQGFVDQKHLDQKQGLQKEDIETIAEKFNVSVLVAILRMRNLGYYVPYVTF